VIKRNEDTKCDQRRKEEKKKREKEKKRRRENEKQHGMNTIGRLRRKKKMETNRRK
jgi:hypothetical protein